MRVQRTTQDKILYSYNFMKFLTSYITWRRIVLNFHTQSNLTNAFQNSSLPKICFESWYLFQDFHFQDSNISRYSNITLGKTPTTRLFLEKKILVFNKKKKKSGLKIKLGQTCLGWPSFLISPFWMFESRFWPFNF